MFSALIVVFSAAFNSVCAQYFEDVTDQMGIEVMIDPVVTGNSASFYDWNYDGLDDLTFCKIDAAPQFYQNTGDGFIEVQPFITTEGECRQLSWVDFDNDGDADLFLTCEDQPYELWENDGEFNFTEISEEAGFPDTFVRNYAFCWGDYDRDGWLDVYVSCYWDPSYDANYDTENHLFKNNGDGTFEDVTYITNASDGHSFTLAPIFWDYDRDGDADIYVVNDKWYPNTLLENPGNGHYEDVSVETGTDIVVDGMSATPGDFNNDGKEDIYVTSSPSGNVLLQGGAEGEFTDVTADIGVIVYEMCWGSAWFDPDLDTDLDLYVCTQGSWANGNYTGFQNHYYSNSGGGELGAYHYQAGMEDDDAHSHSIALGDFNLDGKPDYALSNIAPFPCQLWKNTVDTDNHFIGISLQGTISNREAIGSWIHVYADGEVWSKYTYSSVNYLSQNSQRYNFGLAQLEEIDSVVIDWTNGMHQNFGPLEINQYHHLIEGYEPTPSISSDQESPLCAGDEITLSIGDFNAYLWSTGDTTQSIVISEPGVYWVEVLNDYGLSQPSEDFVVEFAIPANYTVTSLAASCSDSENGSIAISSDEEILNMDWFSLDMQWLTSGATLANMSAGAYIFMMTDLNCDWQDTLYIDSPEPLMAETIITTPTCFGDENGSADINPFGGTLPYTILWNDLDPSSLSAGSYLVEIIDSATCSLWTEFQISEPPAIQTSVLITEPNCFGYSDGHIETEASGGTGLLTMNWGQTDPMSVGEGTYDLIITDSVGCQLSIEIEVDQPEELSVELEFISTQEGFEVSGLILGGTPPFEILWSNGETELEAFYQEAGNISVVVTDANDCLIEGSITITSVDIDESHSLLVWPNPAGDLINISGIITPANWVLYDISGRVIETGMLTRDQNSIQLSQLSPGTYVIGLIEEDLTETIIFQKL